MAFDSNRNLTVLLGGNPVSGPIFNDTWEWDGELWTQVADSGPTRRNHAAVFDNHMQRTIIFGGVSGINETMGDTWAWDGINWTQLSNSGPSARTNHAMAYDSIRKRIILFGGRLSEIKGDTWEFDGESWMQSENSGPSARFGHVMAFDHIRDRVVLYGGISGKQFMGDTWEWNGTSWTKATDFGPEPVTAAAMVFMNQKIALFGGASSMVAGKTILHNNTWEWNGKHWTQRQDIGPEPCFGHSMSFDIKNSRIVLFGGLSGSIKALGDTWEHVDHITQIQEQFK
jgi:hypothetical protein